MASIRFYLKDKKNGSCHIMAAFQNGDKCPTRYTGYSIPSTKAGKEYKFWNKNAARVRSMDPAICAEINKRISDWKIAFSTYISNCNVNKIHPDIANFINSLPSSAGVNVSAHWLPVPGLVEAFALPGAESFTAN